MSGVISPEPVTAWRPGDLPPYLSNGLIGLRLGTYPLASGMAVVSGLTAVDPVDGIPTFALAPYPLALDIIINRVSMASAPQCCVLREQHYDFSCGEVKTRFGISVSGIQAEVSSVVFCSRTRPSLALEELTVRVDRESTYSFSAEPGREYRLRRIVSLVPVTMHVQPDLQAVRLVHAGQIRGFDQLRQDNRDEWGRMWEGRVVLAGAPSRWQRLADAAYFYLHTSAHQSSPGSTPIFGLANWPNYPYYRGHVMWDVETFVLPPLMFTNPDIVRGLLSFRHTRIQAARANAQLGGLPGLEFPWEASLTRGEEAAPLDAASPAVEQHVSMDVALAFAYFAHVTDDYRFSLEQAWPVLSGVAEWITGRVEPSARGYEIRQVNGIAETKATVDNNAFVNMGAILTLRAAAMLGRALGYGDVERWEGMADRIVIPFDSERGIKPVAGPFAANMGGFLGACLYGLPGIHVKPGPPASWFVRPVVLPQGWDAIHVERGWVRGQPTRLVAEHGAQRARLVGQAPPGGDLPG